jgi:large subunit ribosomal protein L18
MDKSIVKRQKRNRRHRRIRRKVAGTAERPRLCVFRSLRHIYAQLVDDDAGRTLVAASSHNLDGESGNNTKTAQDVGKLVAERAREKQIDAVIFDRGGYRYHGRIKALADAARENGLKF